MYNLVESLTKLALATSISLALTECGGGSDSASPVIPPVVVNPVPTSTLEDQFTLYLEDLSDKHIIPSYAAMQTEAQTLKDSADVFCALLSANNKQATRQAHPPVTPQTVLT
jgi:predicted lipoprotein